VLKNNDLRYAIFAYLQRSILPFAAHNQFLFPIRTSFRLRGPDKERKNTMLVALINFLQAWRRYNNSLRELYQLGDRELADIGISRSDIPRVAWDTATH
jgi:uncharacterized protein YjiS (DUF1127 family)